jgi:hypothetical protein
MYARKSETCFQQDKRSSVVEMGRLLARTHKTESVLMVFTLSSAVSESIALAGKIASAYGGPRPAAASDALEFPGALWRQVWGVAEVAISAAALAAEVLAG